MKFLVCFAALLWAVPGLAQVIRQGQCPSIPPMSSFNITRYLGNWYEIERFPNFFQSDTGSCGRAEYSLLPNGRIKVVNKYIDHEGVEQSTIGEAYVPDPHVPSVLSVYFDSNPSDSHGEYRVVQTDYVTFSLVTSCREFPQDSQHIVYAWILSRQLTLSSMKVDMLKALIGGLDVSKFIVSNQIGCPH